MLFIESFAEKYKREFLDRREQSKALFDLAKGILDGEPRLEHEDTYWLTVLVDETHTDADHIPHTIMLRTGEKIDVFYRFTVWYETRPESEESKIYPLLDICISENVTVVSDTLHDAIVDYPERANYTGTAIPYRQMNPAEIAAFYEDLKRFAEVSKSSK